MLVTSKHKSQPPGFCMERELPLLKSGDYVVVGTMVFISTGIGLYYGVTKKKQSSPFEYFLASRQMSLIPMAFSAFATGMGPATVLGTPTESYNFGMQIVWWCLIQFLIAFILNWIFIPLYHKMGSMNVYKFLEVRYNTKTKNVVTTMAAIRAILQCSNVVFGTATALNSATDIDTWIIIVTITGLCVLYTSVGGMKGVMWSDVIQAVAMILSFLTIIIMGLIYVGGVGVVWQRSYDSGRLDIFDFNMDPTARHTFWTSTIGYFFSYLAGASTSQLVHQRFLTAPSLKEAKRGNLLSLSMTASTVFLSQVVGLIIYAEYYSCDPMKAKTIKNLNQLVPAFVMKVMGEYPILPGLFFAGLLAAALSTMSSVYNSIPAIIMESLVIPSKPNMSPKQATFVCKVLAVIVGVLNVMCIFFTQNFPNVKQASVSTASIVDGSLLVLILLGLLLPQANFKAALLAFLSGILMSLWIVIGTLIVKPPLETKPLSVEGCSAINMTFWASSEMMTQKQSSVDDQSKSPWIQFFPLHSLSYIWISTIVIFVSSTVFFTMSQVFAKDDKWKVIRDVIPTSIQNFHLRLPKSLRKVLLCDIYDEDDNLTKIETQTRENVF